MFAYFCLLMYFLHLLYLDNDAVFVDVCFMWYLLHESNVYLTFWTKVNYQLYCLRWALAKCRLNIKTSYKPFFGKLLLPWRESLQHSADANKTAYPYIRNEFVEFVDTWHNIYYQVYFLNSQYHLLVVCYKSECPMISICLVPMYSEMKSSKEGNHVFSICLFVLIYVRFYQIRAN